MDQNIRATFQVSTFYYFMIIFSMTSIGQLITMLTIVFADITGKELLVTATVVATAFFGAFGTVRILTNMSLLLNEMDDKTAATNYGREMQAIPLLVLRFVFAAVFIIVAIIQIITIFS